MIDQDIAVKESTYRVTIAIPFYNVAEYVGNSIQSALDQTFESIEYLLIDDKSTDHSREVISKLIENHPRRNDVRIIEHEKNMGIAVARNTALDHATGEYFYFLDSDDVIPRECIEILYRKMEEHPVDFVAGSYQTLNLNGKILESFVCNDTFIEGEKLKIAGLYYHDFIQKKWLFPSSAWNKLFRRSFLTDNKIRCFPGYVYEDNIFIFNVILQASSCSVVSNITYFYYRRPGSIMNPIDAQKASDMRINSMFFVLTYEKEQSKQYVDHGVYTDLLTVIMYRVWLNISTLYVRSLDAKRDKQKIRAILRYPTTFGGLKKLKKKKIYHYVFYMIGRMPYFVQRMALRFRYYKLHH